MQADTIIVIADDERGHFLMTKYFLKNMGIQNELVWLVDGEETVDYFLKQKREAETLTGNFLLLLDIRMPKIDGIEVLEILKKDESLKKIPVIMVTTNSDPKNIERCEALGCFGYVVKPLQDGFKTLLQKL